jgi:hypothetical protein
MMTNHDGKPAAAVPPQGAARMTALNTTFRRF